MILSSHESSDRRNYSQPNVSTNHIVFPNTKEMHCDNCGNDKFNLINDIDTSNWDVICPECDNVVFKHPKRDERIEQLKNMLD